jgi:3-deoxy-D-manno-octulosonic-acid transferase
MEDAAGGGGALRVYAAATRLATPLVAAVLRRRAATGGECAERFGHASLPRPPDDAQLLWCHAVSVGEAAAAAPLVAALRAAHGPRLRVLLTAGSAHAHAARAADPAWAGALLQLAPVDTPAAVARFLAHWRPCALLLLESELWPNLLEACAAAGVPVALVNARACIRAASAACVAC